MANPGPGLGSAIVGAGRKLGSKIAGAQSGYMDVAKTAIEGKYKAEAQERAHGQTKSILKKVHKRAGAGTQVDIQVDHTGSHRINYSKQNIGEKLAGAHENAAVKDFKNSRKGKTAGASSNPTRDGQGFRHDQPDHHGNGKAMAEQRSLENHPNVFRIDAQRVEPKALTASNNAVAESRKSSGPKALGDGGAAGRKAITAGSSAGAGNPAAKKRGMGMVDRTNAGKVNNRLNRFEERHLAERGNGAKSTMNKNDKWADTAAKRQGLPSLNTPVSELEARAKKGDYTPVSGAALARAKYYGLQDKK